MTDNFTPSQSASQPALPKGEPSLPLTQGEVSRSDGEGGIQVTLTRQKFLKTCTLGFLRIQTRNLVWKCKTLELPDRGNKPQISCIPAGTYTCRRINSPKFGDTFEVCGVPDRSQILFHPGNSVKDTRGCILVGISIDYNGGTAYLEASRAAMKTLRQVLEGISKFDLVILEATCLH